MLSSKRRRDFFSPDEVLKEIRTDKFRPVYLLVGEARERGEEIVSELKRRIISPGFDSFDFESVSAQDIGSHLPIAVVVQRIRQAPFVSPKRLVVIRDAHSLSSNEFRELLNGLAKSHALGAKSSCVTVVFYNQECQTPWGGFDQRLIGEFEAVGLGEAVVDCRPLTGEMLINLLKSWGESLGLKLTPGGLRVLVDICGEDLGILKRELEKFACVLKPGEGLDEKTVLRYAGMSRVFEIGEYVKLVMLRKAGEGLVVLHRLEEEGEEPVVIIAWLTQALIEVMKGKVGEILPERMWRAPKAALALWSVEGIRRALEKLYYINVEIVSGHPEPFLLLDMWTVGIGGQS